jgi:hypothetical protein
VEKPYLIVQVDYDSVALGDVEQGKRPLSIDSNDSALCLAIWIASSPAEIPIVGDRVSSDSKYQSIGEE